MSASGLEVIRWIKDDEELSGIPVICLYTGVWKGDEEKLLNYGFDAIIYKPIKISNFLQTIEKYLG